MKKRNIPKGKALMVGDSYVYDYKPAKKARVGAILINNSYNKNPNFKKVKNKIKRLKEILELI